MGQARVAETGAKRSAEPVLVQMDRGGQAVVASRGEDETRTREKRLFGDQIPPAVGTGGLDQFA